MRDDMPENDGDVIDTDRTSRLDKLFLFERENFRSHEPRALHPGSDTDHNGYDPQPSAAERSGYDCTLERGADGEPAIRLGLRLVKGLGRQAVARGEARGPGRDALARYAQQCIAGHQRHVGHLFVEGLTLTKQRQRGYPKGFAKAYFSNG